MFNLLLEILDLRTEARLSFLKCVGLDEYSTLLICDQILHTHRNRAYICSMLLLEQFVLFLDKLG